ncbi:hypothetical protein [Stappia sp.]|jgi:hypothetical protein|uniref:hypothetical protein n=1 Tax=Stappia sp. TaxID=1870903 RepID=UPI003A994B7D
MRHLLAGVALLTVGATCAAAQDTATVPPALASAYERLDAAWAEAPLGFTAATFVSGDVTGYGQYTPRADAVFAAGEPLVVYAEPVGFGHAATDDGFRVALAADYEILNPSGQVLASQSGFAELGARARVKIREFHTTLRFAFEGLRPGDYRLVTRLRDTASDKTGSFVLPFTVKAAAQAN